ncbi:MAG: phage head-tail connector protein [Planctomycetes bacterium]|nr:phage head-tail connector protein [Planctomycetota bacterium]
MQPSLTTLDNTKAWLGITTTGDDLLLYQLIAKASRYILSYLQRPDIFRRTYTEVYDGSGSGRQILRNYPVLSVGSLAVGTNSISASPAFGQSGFMLESWDGLPPGHPQALDLYGYTFCRGNSNVAVTYTAGYAVLNETQTVPGLSNYSIRVHEPFGIWAADNGVTYADGTALTPVDSVPAAGQYSTPGDGIYQFSDADANAAVLVSYSFVPFDVEQACIELVAERYNYKDRVGVASKSLGGQETVSYSLKAMPDHIATALQPFKRTVMV